MANATELLARLDDRIAPTTDSGSAWIDDRYGAASCTLAHDNELPDKAEARFIFDSVTAILRFVRAVDTVRYESSAVGAN
ncbi:hypothetical protein HFO93_07810 [Rhizobium leguminosarum]|uniref:hypothetical protein n=1 Tax=Rhizobium leguminosarum TaxID=384 RepID=UPI001C939ECA|nr:hypothetical protein [Rhizobium leguminosarum]MBY5443382.1 hypothetical protein [Rhizobium leguminosarum]